MVRFILNNGNSTLENGVYTFELDKRLSNATSARINKASFVYSPSGVGPLAVYLRSDALHHISGRKHTVELKNTQHENSSNILAVLEETHSTNRYRLRGRERVIPLKYTHLRNLDFYFTGPDGVNLVGSSSPTTFVETTDNFDTPTDQEKTVKIVRSYDTGGSDNNYGANETLNRIYISENGVNFKIKVLGFTTESGYDMLSIFNVADDDSQTTILDGLPSPADFTSTESKIKFQWQSDGSNNAVGFDILIYEDNDGTNTLTSSEGVYSVTIPGDTVVASWVAELDINTS